MSKPTESILLEHVESSIELGSREKSKLDRAAFRANGFTSPKVRHLLNNLGSLAGLDYLEVGVHRGATFVATNYKNTLSSAVAVDNWSEFDEEGTVKDDFLRHCSALLTPGSYDFVEQDCFSVTPEQIRMPVNFYFYDGEHSHESQRQALTHYYPMLDDVFIFLVDDYTWASARTGTVQAIAELDLEVLYQRELVEGWWNGVLVSVLKKKLPMS
jgi:protein O-GlcNAc transferase